MGRIYSFLNKPERFFESAFYLFLSILLPEHIRIMERCKQNIENREAEVFVSDIMWIILIKQAALFQGILNAFLSRDTLAKFPPGNKISLYVRVSGRGKS